MALIKYKLGVLIKQRREKYDGSEEPDTYMTQPLRGFLRSVVLSGLMVSVRELLASPSTHPSSTLPWHETVTMDKVMKKDNRHLFLFILQVYLTVTVVRRNQLSSVKSPFADIYIPIFFSSEWSSTIPTAQI